MICCLQLPTAQTWHLQKSRGKSPFLIFKLIFSLSFYFRECGSRTQLLQPSSLFLTVFTGMSLESASRRRNQTSSPPARVVSVWTGVFTVSLKAPSQSPFSQPVSWWCSHRTSTWVLKRNSAWYEKVPVTLISNFPRQRKIICLSMEVCFVPISTWAPVKIIRKLFSLLSIIYSSSCLSEVPRSFVSFRRPSV